MAQEAAGHWPLSPEQQRALTREALLGSSSTPAITLDEVNQFAREFFEFLGPNANDVHPSAVVISSSPSFMSNLDLAGVNQVAQALQSPSDLARSLPSSTPFDTSVDTLLSPAQREELSSSSSLHLSCFPNMTRHDTLAPGKTVERRLRNGLNVRYLQADTSGLGQVHVRLEVRPPPNSIQSVVNRNAGIMTELGARVMQEGGAILNRSKAEVELFCIEKDISVDIYTHRSRNKHSFNSDNRLDSSVSPASVTESTPPPSCNMFGELLDDGFTIDLSGPLVSPDTVGHGDDAHASMSGLDALLQLLHGLVSDFNFSSLDALHAAATSVTESRTKARQHLEKVCLNKAEEALFGSSAMNSSAAKTLDPGDFVNTTECSSHMKQMVSGAMLPLCLF